MFPAIARPTKRSVLEILRTQQLLTDLQFALDAGDAASYTSGQSWLDLSGNGQDFFLGNSAAATSADPTFTGTAGGLSSGEYFAHDGSDYFEYDTTNEAWMENLHKDNAVGSFCGWVYLPTTGAESFLGTCTTSGTGAFLAKTSGDALNWNVRNAGAGALSLVSTATFNLAAWNFFGFGINEATGANGANLIVNGVSQSFTSTYASPSASSATAP